MSRFRKRVLQGALAVGLALVVGAIGLLWKSGFFDSYSAEERSLCLQGMALHAAIWHYEEAHGQLPGQLTDLVPNYLKPNDLEAPEPHAGSCMFRLVRPERPTAERRMNDDLLVSIPFTSKDNTGKKVVYVQEDGEVGARKVR